MTSFLKLSIASLTLGVASIATPALAGTFAPTSMAAYQAAAAESIDAHLAVY